MRTQTVIVGVILAAAMIAVPLFYNHRMNAAAFIVGLFSFIGIPFFAGILQSTPNRTMLLVAGILLALCPLVYVVTDGLAVHFEKLRDGHFLATGATIIFVSASWLAYSFRSRKWPAMFSTAALATLAAATAVYVMLWMFIYFE